MDGEPLRDYEIKVLRGMIDEHRRKLDREETVHHFWTTGKVVVVSVAGIIIFLLQVITMILALRHG